eukprot:Pompholyxophrys_sp_v1_NODE_73_length_2430_cov_9.351579.p1 type:complete len:590 gc:universal NODE_73_length_2430_cov_9.351579:2280-511(-)
MNFFLNMKDSERRERDRIRKANERERKKAKVEDLEKTCEVLETRVTLYETRVRFYEEERARLIEQAELCKALAVKHEKENYELIGKVEELKEEIKLSQERCKVLTSRCTRNLKEVSSSDDDASASETEELCQTKARSKVSDSSPSISPSMSPSISPSISWQKNQRLARQEKSKMKDIDEQQEAEFHYVTLMEEILLEMGLHEIQILATGLYFYFISQGHGKTEAFKCVSDLIDWSPNTIRKWRDQYVEDGAFLESGRGKFVKVPWLLEDEDLQLQARMFIRENANRSGEPNMTSLDFAHYLNTDLLKDVVSKRKTQLSNTTALNYIKRLGFTVTQMGKNTFIDGHSREDVVEYRQKIFLPEMKELEKRAKLWSEDGQFIDLLTDESKEYTTLRNSLVGGGCFHPNKPPESREVLFVYQDESTGKAGSMQKFMYAEEGKALPAKKNEGGSFMISGFAIEQGTGRISFTDEQYQQYLASLCLPTGVSGPHCRPLPQDADVYIEVGKNKDGHWDSERFINQMKDSIDILEYLYPDVEAVFLLDHSGGHTKKPDDGLNAHVMNVNPGGKQPVLRNTTWNGQPQVIGNRGLKAV